MQKSFVDMRYSDVTGLVVDEYPMENYPAVSLVFKDTQGQVIHSVLIPAHVWENMADKR